MNKICKTCKHFWSYYAIYDYDPYEPTDIGECWNDNSPLAEDDKFGITWEDTCDGWEQKDG